ncbi:MAG: DUF885 domain-containing protein, partial [Actinomycetota bacterium]|nr:DUF885 domain-containing protein [Actinomycetota bacterium]
MSDVVALADEYWSYYRGSAQLWNIDRGDVDQIEHWEDLSPLGVASRIERLDGFVSRAEQLSTGELSERDSGLLAAISFSARATASTLPCERDLALVAGPFNFVTFVSVLVPGYSLVTREHGDGYVAKLRSMPSFIDGWIAGLRDGAASARVATARGIIATVAAFDALLGTDPIADPLASQTPPRQASAAEISMWRAEVSEAIREATRPALARLRSVLHDELLLVARSDEQAGLCHQPGGEEAYGALLWAFTSTDLTPDAVHQLGLQQLALLDDEYRQLGPTAVGAEDPAELREQLRMDPLLRYTTAEEIVADAMASVARAEAVAPQWFTRLPRARCNATAVATGPMAFYTGPSPDGSRGGTYFYNTAVPSAWTRYQLEVTTFHEAVPGHHLQLALAQECDLHPVVGEIEVASYGEGWGLYAERLADEMGLYSSPLQRIGMLTLDSLRAARLVVDTGIHSMGWTRDTAIDFLLAHTATERRSAEAEVDRYIATPGQATSYMVGRLEIDRLRRHAEQR